MGQESCSGYSSGHLVVKDMAMATHGPAALLNRCLLALMIIPVEWT